MIGIIEFQELVDSSMKRAIDAWPVNFSVSIFENDGEFPERSVWQFIA